MLTNKEIHKFAVKEFNVFFRCNGYKRRGERTWFKIVNNELLQLFYLVFSYGQENFNFDIAFMPLCVPKGSIDLNFSARLHRFDMRGYRTWGSYDQNLLDSDVLDAENIITDEVFPWIENIDNYEKFVSLLSDKKRGEKIGFLPLKCHILEVLPEIFYYTHQFDKAENSVNDFKDYYSSCLNDERILSFLKRYDILRSYYEQGKPELIDKYFDNVICENLTIWKIIKK